MRRGTLIMLFWDYVAGLLGQEGRLKSFSITKTEAEIAAFIDYDITTGKNYDIEWSSKFDRTSLMKNLFLVWQKDTIENCKMNSQKIFFSLLQLPPWGALRYLYRKNITNIHLLNTETAHRFMRHQNEHSKRAKWVYITRSKNMHFWK